MEPVTIALALAKATGLDEWITSKISSKLGNKTATKIVDLAKTVAGSKDPEEALQRVSESQELANELKKQLMQNKHQLTMAAYADRTGAREIYKVHPEQADRLSERIMKWNLPYIAFLLVANCAALYFLKDHSELLIVIGNVLGMAIKSLFDERKEVTGFYFGGSMQSSPDNKD